LLFDDQPASTIPYTPIDVIAKTTRTATFTSATPSFTGVSSSPKKVVLGAPRDRGKRRKAAVTEIDRRQREEPLVRVLRPQLLLEQQLQDVGNRLQHPVRSDQVRAVSLLHESHDLPLGEHENRRGDDQRVEHHEDHHADHGGPQVRVE
jgi:hypothetical protein